MLKFLLKFILSESYNNKEESSYEAYTNLDNSNKEEMRKRNINKIISSDSDIDKCNSNSEIIYSIIKILLMRLY